jgi:hypothetical protein
VLDEGLSDAAKLAVCHGVIAALNDRALDRYFAYMHADYAIRTDPSWDGGGVLAQRPALRRFFEETFDYWAELEYGFVEGPEVIGERVLSRDRWRGRNPGDEEWTTIASYWAVATFRGELVARVDTFGERDAAVEFARAG